MSLFKKKAREAEQAVIGAVLLNDSMLMDCDLVPSDFLDDMHKQIWSAVLSVHAQRITVDLVTLCTALRDAGRDWTKYVSDIGRNVPSASNWRAYADHVKRYSRLAQQEEILDSARGELLSGEDVADSTITALMQLSGDHGDYDCNAKEMLVETIRVLEETRDGKIKTVKTGLADLDAALGGLHPSDLIVVAGRPAMGKTAVMLNFAISAGAPVGIVSSEQGRHQIGSRLLSLRGSIPVERMRSANLTQDDWANVAKASHTIITNNHIFINDKPKMSITDIERQARKWKHLHDIKALYVDYIQRIEGGDSRAPKHERVGDIVKALKNIARELDIPVIALAQVNRKVEERTDRRPTMGDIADSSEVEKEADQIITLYRDEVYNENSQNKGLIEFLIRKNRHGETKTPVAQWRGEFMRITDVDWSSR